MFAAFVRARNGRGSKVGHALCDRVESLSDQVADLMEHMNQPADGSLEDCIKQLTEAMKAATEKPKGDLEEWIRDTAMALRALQDQVVEHGGMLRELRSALPAEVARAVVTGKV